MRHRHQSAAGSQCARRSQGVYKGGRPPVGISPRGSSPLSDHERHRLCEGVGRRPFRYVPHHIPHRDGGDPHLPSELACRSDSDDHNSGITHRHLRRDEDHGLLAQYALALRPCARDSHCGRRCHSSGGRLLTTRRHRRDDTPSGCDKGHGGAYGACDR